MEERLKALVNSISLSDAEGLLDGLAAFDEGHILTDEEQQRILVKVMRKAGYEMNETMQIKTNKKRRSGKRLIMLIAAAVIMVLGALGAGAYFLNMQGILNGLSPHFSDLKEATDEELEALGGMTSAKGELTENTFEGIDISYDGVVCDGYSCYVIFTFKKSDGTAFKTPEGCEWRAGYADERLISPFAGDDHRYFDLLRLTENEDGTLSMAYQSFTFDPKTPMASGLELGLYGLYCVPALDPEVSYELLELGSEAENAYIQNKDSEAARAAYTEALEKHSAEYYKGSVHCKADPDGIMTSAKEFTAQYKGEKINIIATAMTINIQCNDSKLFTAEETKQDNRAKLCEDRFAAIEIYYNDGTCETAKQVQYSSGGNAQNFSFSFAFSTGRPILVSKIDHIVFDGETIKFDA